MMTADLVRVLELRGQRVLELRDPDPMKPRHQYSLSGGWLLVRRVLPPEAVGDQFVDDAGEPWWEPVLDLPGGLIRDFWAEEQDQEMRACDYGPAARRTAAHVVAYTPNGRQVRYDRATDPALVIVQPCDDNYWVKCTDLRAARRAYYLD